MNCVPRETRATQRARRPALPPTLTTGLETETAIGVDFLSGEALRLNGQSSVEEVHSAPYFYA